MLLAWQEKDIIETTPPFTGYKLFSVTADPLLQGTIGGGLENAGRPSLAYNSKQLNFMTAYERSTLDGKSGTIRLIGYSRIDFDPDNDGVVGTNDSCPTDFNPGNAQTLNSEMTTIRMPVTTARILTIMTRRMMMRTASGMPARVTKWQTLWLESRPVTPGAPLWDNICFI